MFLYLCSSTLGNIRFSTKAWYYISETFNLGCFSYLITASLFCWYFFFPAVVRTSWINSIIRSISLVTHICVLSNAICFTSWYYFLNTVLLHYFILFLNIISSRIACCFLLLLSCILVAVILNLSCMIIFIIRLLLLLLTTAFAKASIVIVII